MAFKSVNITVAGSRTLRERLLAIRDLPKTVAKDPRIEDTLVERTKKRFDTKKAPDGRRWKTLSRLFFKRVQNQDRTDILVDTGSLRDSIGVTGRRGTATGLGFRIGITNPRLFGRASTHQSGGISALTGGRVPARPFIGVSRQDVTIIERLLKSIAREKGL